ncbi:MAG TPA: DUF4276 family protein [Candidatus Binataceae bacterium]|nr:DUF4276 family protein [Candidatus Binataceae bacterium]
MKFVLFVEGETERGALPEFFHRWLDPRLPKRAGIRVVKFEGWRDYDREIEKKVKLNLSGGGGDDVIAAIGLLDLYGLEIFPNSAISVAHRYDFAKDYFERKVGDSRFTQYFAVHEIEALLFSDPEIFPTELRKSVQAFKHPEEINFDKPPAVRLEKLYREKIKETYKKVTEGYDLFGKLDPEIVCARCPYFKRLLDDILNLATHAA